MRIAQVSPLYESVPPKLYGGTERVVSFLTEELVDLGHDVTLFASGDSVTRAGWSRARRAALRLDERCRDPLAHHLAMLEEVFARARRVRRHPLPPRLPVVSRWRAAAAFPTSTTDARPARLAGSGAALPDVRRHRRWCRSPTRSARRCRSRTGAAPSTTGCRSTCIRSGPSAGELPGVPGAGLAARSGSTARSRSRAGWACR